MPSFHKFVSDWRPEKIITWAANIGSDCKEYIIGVLDKKQHPEQAYKSCMGILHLAKKVGNDRLSKACKRATSYHAFNYNIIVRILEKGWDGMDDTSQQYDDIPPHQNIPGKDYFK